MEDNTPRISRTNVGTHVSSRGGPKKKSRYTVDDIDGGDRIECSGRYCRSCTAALIADCVALCCCPCAVVNFLALAFVKVPWMVGRRCLGIGKKKKQKKLEMQRKCKRCTGGGGGGDSVVERNGNNVRKGRAHEGMNIMSEISSSDELDLDLDLGENENIDCVSARFEAEKVWLELYQVGHLGFGRVSFTGYSTSG
ncbi:hypothetical protein FEM48_Zijuj04G0026600 [Ziziphus jujuba var. spinosa]|uniref:Uncharacterized protein n=1 Tax=Ziziphus jujuba var. spinosa TaxID=714518 RepID=A0A978VHD2_ZIZJJ|nr:hypothetical protein FEM48_Zijuj04G0026600 [Ziziphus jujuba var. spinosa]